MMEFNKQQSRVCQALAEAVAALCKNLLYFQSDITVQGLLGITVDKKNVILVNILEEVAGPGFGLEPEACEDIKELQGLGTAGLLTHYNISKSLTNGTKTTPAVKEEPLVDKTVKKSYNLEKHLPIPNVEESARGNSLSQTLKYLGVRDALLPIDQELPCLEDIASQLPSQDGLDYSRLTLSPHKTTSEDLIKEETDSFPADLIDNCEAVLESSSMILDFGEESTQGEEKIPCDRCNQMFSHKRSLRRHQQKKHLGINTSWRCDMCSQMFDRKDMLQRHLKRHHGTKELKCPLCGKLFSRHDSIKRHMTMAHSSEPTARMEYDTGPICT